MNHSELARQLERIASRERGLHKMMALPSSDCGYLEQAAAALRAIAAATGTAKTPQAVVCEASQSGPKGIAR